MVISMKYKTFLGLLPTLNRYIANYDSFELNKYATYKETLKW